MSTNLLTIQASIQQRAVEYKKGAALLLYSRHIITAHDNGRRREKKKKKMNTNTSTNTNREA